MEGRNCQLSTAPEFSAKIQRGTDFLDGMLARDGVIYGVTTGYGDSCTRAVPAAQAYELPIHLSRFHGCGLGNILSPEATRSVLAVRLASLTHGASGVSMELLNLLTVMLNADILPVIPEEGSVGASGDLTPLSYVAAALIGEREVRVLPQRAPPDQRSIRRTGHHTAGDAPQGGAGDHERHRGNDRPGSAGL